MKRKGRLLVTLCVAVAVGVGAAWLSMFILLAIDLWRTRHQADEASGVRRQKDR